MAKRLPIVTTSPLPFTYAPPADTGLDLLYQDEAVLVVNKPAGLLSVPGRGEDRYDSMISRVQAQFPDALIVHRLDLDTSGLLVMARGAAMHRTLSILFMERQVDKRYVAVVGGEFAEARGEVNLPLLVDWPNRPRQIVNYRDGKPSLTRYEVLSHDPASDSSRVHLEPITGRTHQLRVHMAAIGHPMFGDTLYGGAYMARAERLLLHAEYLAFPHPHSGQRLSFSCPPPF